MPKRHYNDIIKPITEWIKKAKPTTTKSITTTTTKKSITEWIKQTTLVNNEIVEEYVLSEYDSDEILDFPSNNEKELAYTGQLIFIKSMPT